MYQDHEAIMEKIQELHLVLYARSHLSYLLADPHVDHLECAKNSLDDVWQSMSKYEMSCTCEGLTVARDENLDEMSCLSHLEG